MALLLDVVFLVVFGRRLESRVGALAFLGLYLAGALVAAAAEIAWRPAATVPVVGAAGAVSVAVGACLALHPRARVLVAVPVVVVPWVLRLPVVIVALAWFVLQLEPLLRLLAFGRCVPVSWAGVGAGFALGVAASPLCRPRRRARGGRARSRAGVSRRAP